MFTLHNGDCLPYLDGLQSETIDGIVTDPPYMDYQTARYDASEWHEKVDYVEPSMYANKFFRLLKNNSAVVLFCRWDNFEVHAQAFRDVGFEVKNCIVWDKGNHTAGDLEGNLGYQHEFAVFAVKGNWQRHTKRETNVWRIPHLFSRDKRDHPTEKPIPLMGRAVNLVCASGVILDPFMGIGTTGKACLKMGYDFIGCEKVVKYFQIAKRDILAVSKQSILTPSNNRLHLTGGGLPATQSSFTAEVIPPAKLPAKSPRR
jgi:site-specific DNA-methyltransferase (adenine-specific)